ncbi:hypothetical protein MVEN_00061500 [Mycena venus]|uniref:Uncharacterized protein n=1 Tax=Mycena venus TaxID=2733690 RepID=A0A8H6Z706_9AGAR|nr:hypothetical protein MVEN_00061500 [Mycena venus]
MISLHPFVSLLAHYGATLAAHMASQVLFNMAGDALRRQNEIYQVSKTRNLHHLLASQLWNRFSVNTVPTSLVNLAYYDVLKSDAKQKSRRTFYLPACPFFLASERPLVAITNKNAHDSWFN